MSMPGLAYGPLGDRCAHITGGETDVCVLATVLGAIDFGYRVVLVTDPLCSSSDATHDALLTVYHQRFAQQVETVEMETVLSSWT